MLLVIAVVKQSRYLQGHKGSTLVTFKRFLVNWVINGRGRGEDRGIRSILDIKNQHVKMKVLGSVKYSVIASFLQDIRKIAKMAIFIPSLPRVYFSIFIIFTVNMIFTLYVCMSFYPFPYIQVQYIYNYIQIENRSIV